MITTGKHTYSALARGDRRTPLRRLRDRFAHPAVGSGGADAGFTLIEAIVSFVIFAVITAGAVLAIVAGISTSNTTRDRVAAANVAQQALAAAQAMPVASLSASPVATSTSTVGKEPYTVTRKVDFAQASGSATATSSASSCPTAITSGRAYWMHVAVTVTWPGSNGRSVVTAPSNVPTDPVTRGRRA